MQNHGRDAADRTQAEHGRQGDKERAERMNKEAGRSAGAPGTGTAEARILDRVSRQVGNDDYRRYFEHQTRVRVEGGKVQVTVPTGFVADLIGRRFRGPLQDAAKLELGAAEVVFRIDRSEFGDAGRTAPGRNESSVVRAAPVKRPAPVTPERYRLEDFEVGEPNRMAYAAAVRLTEADCPRSASPLFIHGLCGVGKTHLLQGLALKMREMRKDALVVYTTAEAFMNEFIVALRGGKIDSFRKRYRGVDLLCIDDVQFLNGKTGTQNELLHTFDALDLSGSRIVLASDEHPRRVESLSQALVSRFMSGMVVKLDPPDTALRGRIVARLAQRRGLNIDTAGAGLIASRCAGAAPTVRDIEGVLARIDALRALPGHGGGLGGPVGLVVIRRALGLSEGDSPTRPVRPVRMTHIIDQVCRVLRVEASELFGKGRHKRVVLARSMSATLGRSLTTMSYPEIARALGRPNHSTVITAVKRLERQMSDEATWAVVPYLGNDLDGLASEFSGLNLRALAEQLRNEILRTAPGA